MIMMMNWETLLMDLSILLISQHFGTFGYAYFAETKNLLLKAEQKLVEIMQRELWIVPKSVARSINNSKNKLNSKIILIFH